VSIRKGLVLFFTAVLVFCLIYVSYWAYQFNYGTFDKKQSIRIYPSTHLHQLANKLQQRQLWNHPYIFVLLARAHGFAGDLRFGEYAITPDMTPYQLLENIHASRGLVKHSFRIRQSWTAKQLISALRENPNIKFKSAQLDTRKLEGMIYPDTYDFAWGVQSDKVIDYAAAKMKRVLAKAWATRDKHIPITTPYQALIVASLIQTEAGNIEERPKVAAVIYNRLRKGMRLQIDPTVMFGLGLPYGSILTKRQLEQKTEYNTYSFEGLPPTPIAFPAQTAIEAALHPAELAAFYYVANGKGGHTFSNSYEHHKEAVAQYRAFLNERKWQQQVEALKTIVEEGVL
jgi:UPF0755 protein